MKTISEIKEILAKANRSEFETLAVQLAEDSRKGVVRALEATRRRLDAEDQEQQRLAGLYEFEANLSGGGVVVGLDEVGRGPLAGPLTVGAVVLNKKAPFVPGLNDSKQISEAKRPMVAAAVKEAAHAYAVVHIPPEDIDNLGIMACLKKAFISAIKEIENAGIVPDVVLLDGNPLGIDRREINVIKGDGRCASIAAASVIAKVERDAIMVDYDALYPAYDFASSKGYGSAKHRAAIEEKGLCPIHRVSYCTNIVQPRLF